MKSLEKYHEQSQDLSSQIKAFCDDVFKKWVEGVKAVLSNPNEQDKYQLTGQLMEIDHKAGDLLKVNYSEKLVTLTKDARVIGEHGFKIPKEILKVTETAKKFYREGVTLK
jgi:dynein heavy chain 2